MNSLNLDTKNLNNMYSLNTNNFSTSPLDLLRNNNNFNTKCAPEPNTLKDLIGKDSTGKSETFQISKRGNVQICDPSCSTSLSQGLKLNKVRFVAKNVQLKNTETTPFGVLKKLGMDWNSFLKIKNFDWRCPDDIKKRFGVEKNIKYTSPIVNQAQCGCCYAVSSITTILDNFALNHNTPHLASFNPKGLMNFISAYIQSPLDGVCEGGDPSNAAEFINRNIDILKKYFVEIGTNIDHTPTIKHIIINEKTQGFSQSKFDETKDSQLDYVDLCKLALYANGPITVCLEASKTLSGYQGGVLSGDQISKDQADHAVVCVGWGTYQKGGKDADYFIIRNSWGANWGENGYFRIDAHEMFKGPAHSACIFLLPHSPVPELNQALLESGEYTPTDQQSVGRSENQSVGRSENQSVGRENFRFTGNENVSSTKNTIAYYILIVIIISIILLIISIFYKKYSKNY